MNLKKLSTTINQVIIQFNGLRDYYSFFIVISFVLMILIKIFNTDKRCMLHSYKDVFLHKMNFMFCKKNITSYFALYVIKKLLQCVIRFKRFVKFNSQS